MIDSKSLALSLGIFFSLSFVLCVAYGLLAPAQFHMHSLLQSVLPGFTWLGIGSFILGLVESFAWGLYVGFVFGPVYNFVSNKNNKSLKGI